MSLDPMDMTGPGGQTGAPDDMAAQPTEGSPQEEAAETPQQEQDENENGRPTPIFFSPDMLPAGHQCKSGDILKFKVVNPSDADGRVEAVYDSGYDDGGEDKSYEQGFKDYMSARNSGAGSPEDDGTGNSGAAY